MQSTGGQQYYDLDTIYQEAVVRNSRQGANAVSSVMSAATFALVWASFTKWCQSQIEQGRAIGLQNFGTIAYQPVSQSKRIAYVQLNDRFLQQHGLAYHSQMKEVLASTKIVLQPSTQPEYPSMAKAAKMEKGAFQQSLLVILDLLGELLGSGKNVEVDLHEFGRFQSQQGQVMYSPFNKKLPSGVQGKQTVKNLMNQGKPQSRGGQLPPLKVNHEMGDYGQYNTQQYSATFSYNQEAGGVQGVMQYSNGTTKNFNSTLRDSPTRRYTKPKNQGKISAVLLGAGEDPMSKDQDFSQLASNCNALMNTSFQKPGGAISRFPPVIDPFSRTLAAPVSSQRHYLSVCHRIGTNYTPTAKGFYIDTELRIVRYKDLAGEKDTKLEIFNENDIEPADEHEEYESVKPLFESQKSTILPPVQVDDKRIAARKNSFKRYRQYVEKEISVDVIAPIRQYWLTHIIELIPGDLHYVEKDRIEYMIDTMLNEINKDYFDSVRKSILDYILKDEQEMRRLGIQQVIDQPITWGDDFYKGTQPDEEWKHNVMMARMLMSENLCICSQATLELMRIWRDKDYYQKLLCSLPEESDPPVSLSEFMSMQKRQSDIIKTALTTEWCKQAGDILREELENLDKDQTKNFCDSVSALMSNQVREMATRSIHKYVEFFQRFKKPQKDMYPSPEEVIKRRYDPDSPFELTFLTLKLVKSAEGIQFDVDVMTVLQDLVKIVTLMIEKVNSIPRPDLGFRNPEQTSLWDIVPDDELVQNAMAEIKDILGEHLGVTQRVVNVYDEFLFLSDEKDRVEEFLTQKPYNRDAFLEKINKYQSTIDKIKTDMPYEIRMSMFLIQCEDLNNKIITECDELIRLMLSRIGEYVQSDLATKVTADVRNIKAEFAKTTKTTTELVAAEQYIESVRTRQRKEIVDAYNDMVDWLRFLYKYPQAFEEIHHENQSEIARPVASANQQINTINRLIEDQTSELEKNKAEIEKRLLDETRAFNNELEETNRKVEEFKQIQGSRRQAPDQVNELKAIAERLKKLQETLGEINSQERDLDQDETEFPRLKQVQTNIVPIRDLWDLAHDVFCCIDSTRPDTWSTLHIKDLVPDDIETAFRKMKGKANSLKNQFEMMKIDGTTKNKPARFAEQIQGACLKFEPWLRIIRALNVDGIQQKHVDQMNAAIDKENNSLEESLNTIKKNMDTSIANWGDVKITQVTAAIEDISDTAHKEHSNITQLNAMKEEWRPMIWKTKEHKDTFILEGESVEEFTTVLDDHMIKTQTMKGSPYAVFMLEPIIEWEAKLERTIDFLDLWVSVQSTWRYLEPVFSSEDLMNQMRQHGTIFREVDREWKRFMGKVNTDGSTDSVWSIEGLNDTLKMMRNKLEEVTKGLNQYLESKQGLFPRFYFLSNEELLEILSETKEPLKVQPHIGKCFEGINRLQFDEDKKIHGMKSMEQEEVKFVRVIDPVLARGNVEEWLLQVEEVMIKSVKQQTEMCLQDFGKREREKWVLVGWAGMAIIGVDMISWTQGCEEAMKKNGIPGLEVFYDKLDKQMQGLVGLVRTNITPLQRCTIEAMIVLDVHNKEVIKTEMIEKNEARPDSFAWMQQLRYYWEDNDVMVENINNKCDYNYEYLGNSARLVITPLTDRCYRTLCSAVALNYGGAPEGPAGTGKTETVKDLAKALARQCIVFNCSDQMDHLQMYKFFKGLSACGAWACYDEFNRITRDVLSVIAAYLNMLQTAIDRKQNPFDFDGFLCPLKFTCNCFITMNPGYAGRAELPDNLKALFRTVAMMVPDYALIARVSLFSFGFEAAEALSYKITTTYTLCSEQLSTQKHYDYGMRAVKSVITAAGNLKKAHPDQDEGELVLRAINDVNLAKFLSFDLPLYENITKDLFPGIVLPTPDYDALYECLRNQARKPEFNLQCTEYFLVKIIQLYEMITVRHGLMVVGLPFAGKTSAINLLAAAMGELTEKGVKGWFKTIKMTINPKSVTLAQLYGTFDEISADWADGILPVCYRTLATMDPKDRRWLIFDGPVDAIWIESMNTVLDDNRKLCLTNGEIIAMGQNMTMMFEPMDLLVASPATVSRCGMIYMQPQELGWECFFESWKVNLPKFFHAEGNEKFLTAIDELVEVVVQPCLDYIRNGEVSEMTPTVDQNLFTSMTRNWSKLLEVFDDEKFVKETDKKTLSSIVDSSFIYSAVWSLCISVDTNSRKKFDQHFKKICEGQYEHLKKFNNKKVLPSIMDRGDIYSYVYFSRENKWQNWTELSDMTKRDIFPEGTIVQDIVVTTVDSIRYSYIMENNIRNKIPTLYCGPTGTGKSAYTMNVIMNILEKDKYLPIECGFSAQSKAQMVQGIVDLKLDAKRGKGKRGQKWGPKMGINAVLFVDDLNMPKQEESLAMPPVEIIRAYMDQQGWYELKDPKHPFKEFVDLTVVCAMGPPGGGKSIITPRFQRHFNTVIFALVDEATMMSIFKSILSYSFREGKFVTEVCNINEKLVQGTLNIYKRIQEDLKPTPAKSHYTFNLRDVSKVICGICLMTKKELTNTDTAVRLWAHETTRIFGDRLVNEEDRKWMLNAITDCVRAPFGSDFNTLFRHLDNNHDGKIDSIDEFRGLLFGDIYTPFGMADREYLELLDKDKMKMCANGALEQYNGNAEKPMNLVLFNFAIEHLLRISRIIRQPQGHALLVGVGGSGRQSLTRLASAIPDFDIFQIEIKKIYRMIEFREDVKSLMRGIGGKGQPTTFIFNDNSIKEESFLEDVNNILNTGEVPNIFSAEERVECCDLVRTAAKEEGKAKGGTPAELFSFFIERCKKYCHIVLAFSPIGDALRKRILAFPSLVNCTTIDWFSEWPADALESVAQSFLADLSMDDEVRQSCVKMVQIFHTTTHKQSIRFLTELKRNYYVTPTSFLELISTFIQLLNEKRKQVTQQRDRYANGFKTLIETESKVNIMSEKLEALKPQLIVKAEEVGKQTVVVTKEVADAQVIEERVSADAAVAKKSADASDAIAADCKEALDEALPALKAAEKALEGITSKDITLLKTLNVAKGDVLMVMTTVCILMNVKPVMVMNSDTNKKEADWWGPCKKMLSGSTFKNDLMAYPKEEITEDMIKKMTPYIEQPTYTPERLKVVGSTICSFGDWCSAMYKFYFVNKIVIPKKAALAQAQAEYDVVAAELKIKQAELDKVLEKVNKLKRALQDAKDEMDDLEAQLADCKSRLIKAESLIGSLSKEKERWNALSASLSIDLVNLTGDVLIASGMIAYLGAFNSSYRDELAEMWVKGSSERQIPNSGEFSLRRVLGNPVEIRAWNLQQLPSDDFSVDNAIITKTARRWPLFIDPQGQANKWIRNLGKDEKLMVLKFSNGKYLRYLEGQIKNGYPVLIENVGTELDPAIEPLLQKQIYKKGNSYNIKIGDSVIEYSMNFRFYLTTKLRNPHYLPEVSTKVTLLNFMITYEGLTDQLLGIVVEKENPELQQKKEQLVIDAANNKKKLADIEEQILKTLQESDDILGDEAGIVVLTNASKVSVEINAQQEIAAKTEIEIDEARIGYKPIALTTAGLFFCIQDMAFINTMYQYSLPFFVHLFNFAIDEAEKSDELQERIGFLNKEFLSSLYRNICRSLFEVDKPIFSMLLTFKLLDMKNELNGTDLRFLLTGGVALGADYPECPATWMTKQAWGEMCRVCELKSMKGFDKHFAQHCNDEYKELYDMPDPAEFNFPESSKEILTEFTKLLVLRIIKPDKLVPALTRFVISQLGEEFVQPPPFDLAAIYKDSSNITPLIFVLSAGSDPMKALESIALSKKRQLKAVSLGKGQGIKAENYIKEALKTGDWVVLQNCHLAGVWLEQLEKLCEDLRETGTDLTKVNREFRLWLTSYPADDFPVSILQNGVKMTNEPPKGLRANVINSFSVTPICLPEFFNGNEQSQNFKRLLFGILLFHAVIQERRLYGPLGWINRYEFNEPDLRISVKQLNIFLNTYTDHVPFEALHYCIGQCNYGGRVTDAKDRVLLEHLLQNFFCPESLKDEHAYSPSGTYICPKVSEMEDFKGYVNSLPQFPKPEIFGMHDNAAITKETNETREVLLSILSTMQSSGGGGNSDMDTTATNLANQILQDVPDVFDVKAAEKQYPTMYNESMNTVLTQELDRYNGLIRTIKRSLVDMKRAIKGEILMSESVEQAMISMCDGMIPAMWIKYGFNSLRPLGSYIKDVQVRLEFFQTWLEQGIPQVYWINKFFFTHGFLTGALQNYARKYKIAIDTLAFDQLIVHDAPDDGEGVTKPEDGLYCLGMLVEGARWSKRKRHVDESEPKVLYSNAPMVHFSPAKKMDINQTDRFACPLFKTPDRKGVLMTTGHSTNYVCDIKLPTNVPPAHWVKRGVAMLLSIAE